MEKTKPSRRQILAQIEYPIGATKPYKTGNAIVTSIPLEAQHVAGITEGTLDVTKLMLRVRKTRKKTELIYEVLTLFRK